MPALMLLTLMQATIGVFVRQTGLSPRAGSLLKTCLDQERGRVAMSGLVAKADLIVFRGDL